MAAGTIHGELFMRAPRELAKNANAWAIGRALASGRFVVRRVVWGLLLANEEKREDETIRSAWILVGRERERQRKRIKRNA